MTPQNVIDEARILINDDSSLVTRRFSDADLLKFVNQAMSRACMVRPDLFIVSEEFATTADNVAQELAASAVRLLQVNRVVDGDAVGEVDKTTMDRSAPEWTSEASGDPVNWMRHPRNPRKFYLYPAPSSGVSLELEYVKLPSAYTLSDTIDLPDGYKSAIIDCVVSLAEVVDNENVESERSKLFYNSFLQALGADMSQRVMVDSEDGNVKRQQPQQASGGQ